MKLPFLFGIHCHQPVDNFHSVLDEAIEKCYAPFINTLGEFPDFKCAMHFSGWLLEYMHKHSSSLFSDIKYLSTNQQIEFLTGGFYEPVLAAIPSRDRRGQIKKLSEYIGEHFDQIPKGLWLTERVWDPSIIPDLADCQVEYAVVDDYHFICSGYEKTNLHGYYLTEQDGIALKILPIDQELRYITPFKPFPLVAEYLKTIDSRHGNMAMVFDDGEKFGIWPKTHEWVYEKKWLSSFLEEICKSEQVKSAHFSDFLDSAAPKGIAYLPTTSYMEMGEWSLFANKIQDIETLKSHLAKEGLSDMILPFVKGGIWKNFFAKYPESNWIHKRCLQLSKRAALTKDHNILNSLYKSQCNDVLWHGLFGGLYLPNLRNNAYRYIIETSCLLDEKEKIKSTITDITDINFDGYQNPCLSSQDLQAWFTGKDGGQLVELGCRHTKINVLNTLSRRKEGYHFQNQEKTDLSSDSITDTLPQKDSSSEGIATIHDHNKGIPPEMEEFIVHDWHNRYGFIDHLVKSFNLDEFIKMTFAEMGDFVNQPVKIRQEANDIIFSRQGGVYENGNAHTASLQKRFSLNKDTLNFSITITTEYPKSLTYVMETNWHIYDYESCTINSTLLKEQACFQGKHFILKDKTMPIQIAITFDQDISIKGFAIQTASQSEKGLDLTTQGICLLAPITGSENFNLNGSIKIIKL